METGQTTLGALARDARWSASLHLARAGMQSATWPLMRLGDLVSERREKLDPQDHADFLFCYLGLQNIEGQAGTLVDFEPVLGATIRSQSRVFREGDVLYARLRPYLNKVYAALGAVHTGICSGEFHVLVPDPERVRPLYLREVLATSWIQDHVGAMQFGSALPRVQLGDLLDLEVPVPDRAIQAQIEADLLQIAARRATLLDEATRLPRQVRACLEAAVQSGRWSWADTAEADDGPAPPNALPPGTSPGRRARSRRR